MTFQTEPNAFALPSSPSTLAHAKVGHPVLERRSSAAADANLDSAGGGRPAAAEQRLTRPSPLWSPEHGWKRYQPLPRAAAKNRVKPPPKSPQPTGGGGGDSEAPRPTQGAPFTLLTFARRAAARLPFVS